MKLLPHSAEQRAKSDQWRDVSITDLGLLLLHKHLILPLELVVRLSLRAPRMSACSMHMALGGSMRL